jgi:N-acyl-D-amino-acid deacylase
MRRALVSLSTAIAAVPALTALAGCASAPSRPSDARYDDVVVFDPATIADHASYERPQQYATGVAHVFVNGVAVLRAGEHTGATPGQVVRGPGWSGWHGAH